MSVDLEFEEILGIFFQECAEGLDAMESGLLTLESTPDRDTINTIFRAAHSIKGGAGTFGFAAISEFTHEVETLLGQMRDGSRAVTPQAVHVLLEAVDVMREMTALAKSKEPVAAANGAALTARLRALLVQNADSNGSVKDEAPVLADPDAAMTGWRIEFEPHPSLFTTCNDPLRLFRELEALGALEVHAALDRLPPLDQMDPTQCYLGWVLTLRGSVSQDELREVFDWVDANSSIVYLPLGSERPAAVAPAATAAPAPAAQARPAGRAEPGSAPSTAPPAPVKTAADGGSIRVATEKVDALIDLVGELVITQSMLSRFSESYDRAHLESLRRGLTHLSRNTRELQESVMKIRMLPISVSFNRFPRLVHELSRKLGKKVELRLCGENTELDKIVLEKIGDPLVHLVRNSLDHGLETPAHRLAAGKRETGLLELNAYHEGGNIIIEVKDDGAGLNKARILGKARERGLIDAEAGLTDEQVYNLIFVAGFSTAESVSDVSGRGVGMDVVRRNITDLGGTVNVSSVAGQGSTIRIRLPLTLAILDGQMLRVGKEIYVISLVSIIETVQPKRDSMHFLAGGSEVFKHRDAYLPVIRLHEQFDIEPDSREIGEGLLIVAESDGKRVAILVDELLAQQQVVIKSLDTNFRHVPGLAGATIHGDGTVALILDVPGLIGRFLGAAAPSIAA